jgi:hypothetical protein
VGIFPYQDVVGLDVAVDDGRVEGVEVLQSAGGVERKMQAVPPRKRLLVYVHLRSSASGTDASAVERVKVLLSLALVLKRLCGRNMKERSSVYHSKAAVESAIWAELQHESGRRLAVTQLRNR